MLYLFHSHDFLGSERVDSLRAAGVRDLKTFPDLPQVTRLLSTNDVTETKNANMHLAVFCKLGPSQYHFTMGLKGSVFFFSYREPFLKMAQEQVTSFFF